MKGPTYPRIGDHIRARRHLVGADVHVVLHDERSGQQMLIAEREWRVLRAMDGTRDASGIALASGSKLAHVSAFLETTAELGITAESGPDAHGPSSSPARDLPVVAMPGGGFSCSGIGACCRLADTILFTPLEAAAARVSAPFVLDAGHVEERAFMPSRGLDRTLLAVTAREGACAYLGADRSCSIHDARPYGCRTHPLVHVDVGTAIRVAPRLVCACELELGGAPLTEARRGSELAPEIWVQTLPTRVRVGDRTLSRAEALAWSDALDLPDTDVARFCAGLAETTLGPPLRLAALREPVERLVHQHRWRAEGDLLRRGLGWIAAALGRDRESADPRAEALALRATVFVGGLLESGDAGAALRRLETHIRIARRFPEEARRERFARHPLVVVNAVARATGGW